MRYLLSFLLGLVAGSFANVCISRLPKDQSLWMPGSHCTRCQKPLRFFDNIPLLSFLLLRGRCRFCHAPISWQYPLIELAVVLLFLASAWRFGGSLPRLFMGCVISFYLLVISVIDYRHRIIPDELSLSLLGFGILFASFNPFLPGSGASRLLQSLATALGGGLLMLGLAWGGEKIFKKEALGGGDVKLVAAFGAVLGWDGLLGSLLLGSLTGGTLGLVLLALKKKKLGETLPFGPFLCFGAYITTYFPKWWGSLLASRTGFNFP